MCVQYVCGVFLLFIYTLYECSYIYHTCYTVHLIESLVGIIPRSADLAKAFENGSDEDCLFVKRLALLLGECI